MLPSRIPALLQPLIEDYSQRIGEAIPGFLTAFYIGGSIALDGFNPLSSDIDFVAVLQRKAGPGDLEALKYTHRAVEQQFPRWKMEGSYVQPGDLGHSEAEVEPYPAYSDGELHPSGRHGLNPVTWWILKNHGIAVKGPEPGALSFDVDWDLLIAWMRQNLNSYWVSWTKRPGRLAALLTDWGVQWTVLGVLRQFYTFRENNITTKTRAGEYALSCMPARRQRIIQEAIDLREGRPRSAYRSRLLRANEALSFLKYTIGACNATFK